MAQREQRPVRQPDMDEIGINSFIIYNAKVRPWLKGEGVVVGNHFELLTWRRAGLLARLEMRGFSVRTIEDRIRFLPPLPEAVPLGELGRREPQHPKERYAYFDPLDLRWRDVEPEGPQRLVLLRAGWALRRRRGRGRADYYLASAEKGGKIGLLPLNEADALLMGYAQAREHSQHSLRPILLRGEEGGYRVPQNLILPPPHREILKILTSRGKDNSLLLPDGLDYAAQLFQTLGLALQAPQDPPSEAEQATIG